MDLSQTSKEFDHRIDEYLSDLIRIEAHIRRREKRAARAQLEGLLDELQGFSDEISVPVCAMVVGAQMGFMSGGSLRGRIPAAVLGCGFGWLYGQSTLTQKRRTLGQLIERTAVTAIALDALEKEQEAG